MVKPMPLPKSFEVIAVEGLDSVAFGIHEYAFFILT
jgi:hypothetical protein